MRAQASGHRRQVERDREVSAQRRRVVLALLAACAQPAFAAQRGDFPSRPIHLIVPSPAGSASDWIARLIGVEIERDLGQPIVIGNRPGGTTIIGTDAVARAAPDGYTLGYAMPAFALNRAVGAALPYDSDRQLQTIVQVGWQPEMLVASPALEVKTLSDVIALARREPGRLTYASSGNGSIFHLSAELLRSLAGIDLVHVPYSASTAAITDLIGGRVDLMFNALSSVLPLVVDKKLMGLAVTSDRRSNVAPQTPTVIEAGVPGFEVLTWGGIIAPAGVPSEICELLNARFNAALSSEAVKSVLASRGYVVIGGSAAGFDEFVHREIAKWTKVARQAGLRS
jgi:tripartite-type tricarboxylate transporter receptor subunit TctC